MVKSIRLKSVLRNFVNHFETLESRHKLCDNSSDDSIDLYIREFQTLKELTESLKTDPNCGSNEGQNDVNKRKNRYKDILPYDYSRVILSEYPGVPGSDYMNANYIRGSSGCSRAYIASQGPLPDTVVDFWRMIWESDVTVIVMACNEREAGKYKCESYWPQKSDEKQQYGNITVELVKWRQVCPDFLVRTLKVTADSTSRTVCQFHYQSWPDHGVPTSVHPILELVRLMRDVQTSETRPILIHCSAGCGRTGTICSIDYVWALLRTGKLTEDFSLFAIIKEMRKQRIAMVQTVEQYMLCYRAVATLFEQQLKMIDSHTYENIDGDGEPIMRRELMEDVNQINDNKRDSIESIDSVLDVTQNTAQNNVELKSESLRTPNSKTCFNQFDEVRHERLVGKATVIRRPSIAKLKAIFENQSVVSSEPPLIRSRSTGSSLQRNLSVKDNNSRNSRSLNEGNHQEFAINDRNIEQMISNNYYEQQLNHQTFNNNEIQSHSNENTNQQPIYVELNPLMHKLDHSIDNSQTMDTNQSNLIQSSHFNLQMSQNSQLNDQKIYNHNHQQLQQQIRQHIQQQQQLHHQTQPMRSQTYQIVSHIEPQMRYQSKAPPKPPRTYQHIVEESMNSVPNPNSNEGRLIVSVALPRHQSNEMNQNIHNYQSLGQRACNISSPNLVSDSVLINSNNIQNFNNNYMNGNNSMKMINTLSNTNIYETVLQKYRTQTLEPNNSQNHNNYTQSYYDVMKLRNNGLNSTLPFYDSIYGRRPFITVPNVRQIQPVSQVHPQLNYNQMKHSYENIYSNNNSNNNRNEKPNNEPIVANFVRNIEKSNENSRISEQLSKKIKTNAEKKERNNDSNVKKLVQKNELTKNVSSNCASNSQTLPQEVNSRTFSKFTNAFKGLSFKSNKVKNKTSSNTNNSSNSNNNNNNNNVNGPNIGRPPHSHRFSPPTQWTQV